MNRIFSHTMLIAMTFLMLVSCKGLRSGIGLRGIILDDNMMTLDGDTFRISETIGDSLLIVWYDHAENTPFYLIEQKHNGFYYVQQEARYISAIENTSKFVCIDNRTIYDHHDRTSFTIPCNASHLYYLGEWRGLHAFTNQDSICFSDGKCINLQEYAYCMKSEQEGKISLVCGVQTKQVSLEELYVSDSLHAEEDATAIILKREYSIRPQNEHEDAGAALCVNLEIPKGNSESDKAIRGWMVNSVKDDALAMVCYQDTIPSTSSLTYNETFSLLDKYGELWKKICLNDYQAGDTFVLIMTCDIITRKVADCRDYTTYYYQALPYSGGAHGLPRSYYITYDKRRKLFVHASNTIKPSMMNRFRELALKNLKMKHDSIHGMKSTWDGFTQSVLPVYDTISTKNDTAFLPTSEYMCDKWSGWNSTSGNGSAYSTFPLPHLAILPEGFVLTYHPYQIDCFAAGEYHALIPFNDAKKCIPFSYGNHDEANPGLQHFIKQRKKTYFPASTK